MNANCMAVARKFSHHCWQQESFIRQGKSRTPRIIVEGKTVGEA